ncbi:putative oxidoreductase YusZ [Cytospora mali]|uniref:Oxidoreductase YusZ n=1 Tax=Cytospora mali TaxID=578113 RepID=A0A194UNI0_CYTMA|nr:putative oxidoreductase YusZ [Valsa mali var. pyri (nom. inval.)]
MSTPTFTIPNRPLTWFITGASSGLGQALTRLAIARGHTVIATSRNPAKSPDLKSEIEAAGGKLIALDLTSPSTGDIIAELEGSGTHIDVLVNNAGYCTFQTVESSTEEEVRAQMETIYFGPLRLIRAVVPYMRDRGYGVIVNISSGAALEGADSMGPYAAAKAALDGVTRVLAKEVARFNIRTLTVVAGTFNTNFDTNANFGAKPLLEEYKGSVAELMINTIRDGKLKPNSDKEKGVKAVYEVVVGEGVGKGKEAEPLLLLGKDMDARAKKTIGYLGHALEVFGEVTNGVGVE